MQYYFIVNPTAGGGKAGEAFARACQVLDQKGVEYEVAFTDAPGHATELARQAVADKRPCVVSVGGDGTAREVAMGLLHSGVVMGLLPFGTGNDFAQAAKIPTDPEQAVEILLQQRVFDVDTATANGVPYLNFAGFGFDVDVVIHTEQYKKKFRGMIPYTLGTIKSLFTLTLRPSTITWPDGQIQRRVVLLTAANGTHLGGGMNTTPLADISDGLLDVCVLHDLNWFTILLNFSAYIHGKHVGRTKHFTYFKTPTLTVESSIPSQLNLDGELVGNTPVTFCAQPKSLRMILGQ